MISIFDPRRIILFPFGSGFRHLTQWIRSSNCNDTQPSLHDALIVAFLKLFLSLSIGLGDFNWLAIFVSLVLRFVLIFDCIGNSFTRPKE